MLDNINGRYISGNGGTVTMKLFVDWVAHHVLADILIAGTAFAIGYVIAHRKSLFYNE